MELIKKKERKKKKKSIFDPVFKEGECDRCGRDDICRVYMNGDYVCPRCQEIESDYWLNRN